MFLRSRPRCDKSLLHKIVPRRLVAAMCLLARTKTVNCQRGLNDRAVGTTMKESKTSAYILGTMTYMKRRYRKVARIHGNVSYRANTHLRSGLARRKQKNKIRRRCNGSSVRWKPSNAENDGT